MENLEDLKISDLNDSKSIEIDEVKTEYLQELSCSETEWNNMNEYEKQISAANLIERVYEIEKNFGCSLESIRKQIPSYQLEMMDKMSFEDRVKYVSDTQWQRYEPNGKHQDYGYQRTICAIMNNGECYLTNDIKKYFGCERISAKMVAEVQERLKNQEIRYHYDPIQECNVLTGGLEQYMQNSHTSTLESNRTTEAPQDFEQIQLVSDTLCEMKEFQLSNWEKLDIKERCEMLNILEEKIAEITHRPACPINLEDKGPITISDGEAYGRLGAYNPNIKYITINTELVKSNDPVALHEVLDTVIHEGRHAYQDYNVNECEVHPRHSEVVSWAETMEGGKWGYCGDSSTRLGQRLYEQQSIEIDARNFAADIMDKYEKALIA